MDITEELRLLQESRDPADALRDLLPELRDRLDLDEEDHEEALKELFEAATPATAAKLSKAARWTIFEFALAERSSLRSCANEYIKVMEMVELVLSSANENFARASNAFATQVAEANSPMGTVFAILRKNKNIAPKQFVSVLEAAFPLATNGLDEQTRDHLFQMAQDRGVDVFEQTNIYGELMDIVTAVRFLEDEDEDPEEY